MPVKTMQNVPAASNKSKPEVSSGKAIPETKVKRNALNPKPLKGKAVAVPRWRGQFVAHVLIEALNALQLPTPVKKPKKHRTPTEYPLPAASYALCRGKYPQARQMQPSSTPQRGPFESINRPAGIPIAYIPRLPALPMMFISVADRFRRSAKEGAHAEKP